MANFQEITDIWGHSGRHPGGNIHRVVWDTGTGGRISGSWVMYGDSGISEQEHKLLVEPSNHRLVKNRSSSESQQNFLELRRNPAVPQSSQAPRCHLGHFQGFWLSPCSVTRWPKVTVTDVQPSHVGDCHTQRSAASRLCGPALCHGQWCWPPVGIEQAS